MSKIVGVTAATPYKGGGGGTAIIVNRVADLPDDAKDGTIAIIPTGGAASDDYLYNGIESSQLPVLPEWDKEKYPYAVMSRRRLLDEVQAQFVLWLLSDRPYADGDRLRFALPTDYKNYDCYVSPEGDIHEWEEVSEGTESESNVYICTIQDDGLYQSCLVWANIDVLKECDTAQFAVRKGGKWYVNGGGDMPIVMDEDNGKVFAVRDGKAEWLELLSFEHEGGEKLLEITLGEVVPGFKGALDPIMLEEGKTYLVTTESGTFEAVAKAHGEHRYLGNAAPCDAPGVYEDTGESFYYFEEYSETWGDYNAIAKDENLGSFMIISNVGNVVHKVDKKYLPDGSGLPEVTEEDNEKILIVRDGKWVVDYLQKATSQSTYVPISITYFSHGLGTKEYGEKITEVELSWSLSKPAKALTLDGEEIDVNETSRKITGLSITHDNNNKSWTLVATDARDMHDTQITDPFMFANAIYYGVAAEPETYNSAFILGLTKKLQDYKVTSFSADAGEGQYIYYCLPARLGHCSFTFGPFTGGFDLVSSIDFTNAKGYTEKYNIYRSDYDNLGQTSLTVS